ncbi:ADP-ribosylglycohydrolase family protein [Spirosoma endbachense]|uniref:ADP-ribosylglycohydrolase family protein n=1 Tax=Spirosoma endbachense TaxID=2666025 RepID=A0A6P1VTZ3_9BACT|nr:ADP-ribosylglycohydrolase family protein [Spirosoma endbachense]QHV96691.1 ADP-ribosylglycohydrolase family protein [Spirosoma endbachense]
MIQNQFVRNNQSDDSSLTFCLAEALTQGVDLQRIATNFQKWLFQNYWTPYGEVFDVGIATREAIERLAKGTKPELAGGFDETDNGNGSLMRILPLVFYSNNRPIQERYQLTKEISSITHAHIRSVIACFYYLEFARLLLDQKDKFAIYQQLQSTCLDFLTSLSINPSEIHHFDRLLNGDIHNRSMEEIQSSGYVVHTLEASIWCLLTTDNYQEAVLKSVNLGEDTDTTGAVTGGLAGLLYGIEAIPSRWVSQLARLKEIEALADRVTIQLTRSGQAG